MGSACTDILRAAKALVVSKPIVVWQNIVEFSRSYKSTKFHCSFPPFSTCTITWAICGNLGQSVCANYLIHPFSFKFTKDKTNYFFYICQYVNQIIISSASFHLTLILSCISSSCFSSASRSLISIILIILIKLWNPCLGKAFVNPLAIISFVAFY